MENIGHDAVLSLSTEGFSTALQSFKDRWQLLTALSRSDGDGRTVIHYCAAYKRSDILSVITNCVGVKEIFGLLSNTDVVGWTPLHWSCSFNNTKSFRVMLRYLSQDMRYMLLQKKDRMDNTALHVAASNGHQAILAAILEAISEDHWVNLLHMAEFRGMNVVQFAAYWGKRSTIDMIKDMSTIVVTYVCININIANFINFGQCQSCY